MDEKDDRNDAFELLKELLGQDLALRVADAFAGTALYIPKSVILAEKYKAIRKAYHDGATYKELAMRYGYTQSHIRAIIHKK